MSGNMRTLIRNQGSIRHLFIVAYRLGYQHIYVYQSIRHLFIVAYRPLLFFRY